MALVGVIGLGSPGLACAFRDTNCQPDPKLAVQVTTPSGTVTVKGPLVSVGEYADLDVPWKIETILHSPKNGFTAVHYLGDHAKYWASEIYLVRPDGRIMKLPQAAVLQMLWTPDGKYLVGAGVNTLRLWNLNGKVRMESFDNIRAVSVHDKRICINIQWNGWMQE